MEHLHIIPPAMTSDMFYDVSNTIFSHSPSQGAFWHQTPSRPNGDEQVLYNHNSNGTSGLECPVYISGNSVLNNRNGNTTTSSNSSSSNNNGKDYASNIPMSQVTREQSLGERRSSTRQSKASQSHGRNDLAPKKNDAQDKEWPRNEEKNDHDSNGEPTKNNQSIEDETSSAKESQVTTTLKWLSENYELSEGVCLPRCVLYVHYLDFCKRQAFKPAGAATFGKLIRQRFKNITTRRLGTRGQSKYHYYGIGIKESSIYYQSVYTGKGLTRFSGIKIKTEGTSRKYSLGSKTGTLLPDFPSAHNLILPSHITEDKMDTFLMMYRTHSQRILDTVISANFEEIQNLLIHFWQGYPQHLVDVLQLPVTVDVVAMCDSILYKVLVDVLIPSTIQDLPESLSSDVRAFLRSLPRWIDNSLGDFVPETIRQIKSRVLHNFLRTMKRQLVFVKIAQTARPHLNNVEVTTQALNDLDTIDLDQMCLRTGFALNDKSLGCGDKAMDVFSELKCLLKKQSPVENFTEWLDNLVDKNVLQDETLPTKFRQRASKFLLQWTMFGALIMKDLTLNNAKSFSFLHLIKMTLDEYVFLVMETQTDKHQDALLQRNLQVHMKNAEEIKTNARVRTQANRLQSSPKNRKRKLDENEIPSGESEGGNEISAPNEIPLCQPFQTVTSSASPETMPSTAFSRPLPSSHLNLRDTINDGCTTAAAIAQANEVLRPAAITPHPLPISPIKHYAPYDRPAYLPAFGLNSYTDYIGHHSNAFPNPRQVPVQPFPPDPHVSSQTFQPMPAFNPALNPTTPAAPPPPSYWASSDSRAHASSLTDAAYSQFAYNSYHHQQPYDPYKKTSLLRASVYHHHQDSIARPGATSLDAFPRSNFEGLAARTGSAVDNFARPNPPAGLDGLARSSAAFDPSRSTVPYYPRPHDPLQVGSSFSVGSYSNGFVDMGPPGGQYLW